MKHPFVLLAAAALAGCASTPVPSPQSVPAQTRPASPPPQAPPAAPPVSAGFRAPKVMQLPGLEGVIGRNATALTNLFGTPRLDVREGDTVKLQFAGEACILDVYLYPLQEKAEPTATYVAARRASDGLDVDRAACVAALRGGRR